MPASEPSTVFVTGRLCQHRHVRPATTIALGVLLLAIFAAALVQFLVLAH